jgi:undecaprenyl-diphosphatase
MNRKKIKKLPWRNIISVAVLGFFVIFITLNWQDFVDSFAALKQADLSWIALAIATMIGTYIAAALGYVVVSIKYLNVLRTFLAQVAAAFANKLLPAGTGGLGLNVAFLHKNNYSIAEATTVTTVNSLAAFVSFCLVFISALLLRGTTASVSIPEVNPVIIVVVIACITVAGFVLLRTEKIRKKIATFIGDMVSLLRQYKNNKLRLVGAVAMATFVTLFYLLTLFACAYSLGVTVTFSQVFFVYVLGAVATVAVPTPGGLGAADAALYGGFVALGIDPTTSLSIVLAYRFITYWLPIGPGFISFQYLQRQKLL